MRKKLYIALSKCRWNMQINGAAEQKRHQLKHTQLINLHWKFTFPKGPNFVHRPQHNICLLDNSNNINNKWTNTYGTTKLIAWTPAKGHYNHIPNHFQGPARQRKSEKNGQSKTYSGHFEFLSRFQHVVLFPLLQFGQCWFPARQTQIQAVLSIWMLIKNIYI